MCIRKFCLRVLFIPLILITQLATGQQSVDMEQAVQDNPGLYKGNFARAAIGLSRSTFSYGTVFDGFILNPLHVKLDVGNRMSRKFGAYFSFTGDFLLNARSLGIHQVNQWNRGTLQLGGLYYFTGGNSFFAPEAGVGLISFEYAESQIVYPVKPLSVGPSFSLRYGYERHITGKIFLGGQIFVSYIHTWETNARAGSDPPEAASFTYGAAVSLKLGK